MNNPEIKQSQKSQKLTIQKLENSIVCNYWVSPSEYEQIKKELDRLEKVEYK